MSDEPKIVPADENRLVTGSIGNDDFLRGIGPHRNQTDGGKSSEIAAVFQHALGENTDMLAGLNWSLYTPHFKTSGAGRGLQVNERAAFGVWGLQGGIVTQQGRDENIDSLTYAGLSARYNDTTLSPAIQNLVHGVLGHGRNVATEFRNSPVPEGVHANVDVAGEVRARHSLLGGLEATTALTAAAMLGDDAASAAVGARLAVGRGLDALPETIPNANPEALALPYVRDPAGMKAGNWRAGIAAEGFAIQQNPYLPTGEAKSTVWRAVADAAVSLSSNVTIGAAYEVYDNPAAHAPATPRVGPAVNHTLTVKGTVRF